MIQKVSSNPTRDRRLDEQALVYLKKNGSASVKQLHEELKPAEPSLTEAEATDLVCLGGGVYALTRRDVNA